MEYARRDPGYRPVNERLRDFNEVELRLSESDVLRQAARCMDCGTPFCHSCGCPLENFIPEINEHVYHGSWRDAGRWRDALELLLLTNPFPEFTGRVCPALCESSCVLGINDEPVAVRQAELAVIEEGFQRGFMKPRPPAARNDKRVAVAGSGPAGLAAANALNRGGYNVTVFETGRKPGGILRYGIPDFKLEKWVLDRRIKLMQEEGIGFECGVETGRDISYRYISGRFSALILSCGARAPRDLRAPGRDSKGIHFAMPFLEQQNMRIGNEPVGESGSIHAGGKRVVVIGGGDTGSDCVGTALRQGAVSVTQIEIMPEPPSARPASTPWPEWPLVRRDSSSHKEGGVRFWSIMTEGFSAEAGRVAAVNVCEVEWERQGSGGMSPRKRPGSEFALPADMVLLAMGFSGPGAKGLIEEMGLLLDERGFVKRDAGCMTSRTGVFAAGDMSLGASLVVRAIADGRRAAEGAMRWLESARREGEVS